MHYEEDIGRFIPLPQDEELSIWRYVDFTKYVALLENRELFFPRVSTLDDPFEGSFPPDQTVESRLRGAFPPELLPDDAVVEIAPDLQHTWKAMRWWASVSCWHASEYESAAMWQLYSPTDSAIAIKSTIRRLRNALGPVPAPPSGFGGPDRLIIGMVEYIDYQRDRIPDGSFAAQFFRKRRSFEHEREVRAMVLQFPRTVDGKRVDLERRPDDRGVSVPADLDVLLADVRVAPASPPWYADLVERVSKRYGLRVRPSQSELDGTPVF